MFEVVNTGLRASTAPVNGTVRAGDYITSVQVPRDQSNGNTVAGGIREQMTQTLENLRKAIAGSGATMLDIYEVIIYLRDPTDFDGMNEVYKTYFNAPYPSRATIIAGLIGDTCRVEIVARAYTGKS